MNQSAHLRQEALAPAACAVASGAVVVSAALAAVTGQGPLRERERLSPSPAIK